jgi:hypothetical protein
MGMRVTVNGREVTNPAVRAMALMVMMTVIAFVLALLAFVALPLLGVAVGAAVGLLAVGAGSLLIGIPLAIRRGLLAAKRRESTSGDLPARAWENAEETEYRIEDVPRVNDAGSEKGKSDDDA